VAVVTAHPSWCAVCTVEGQTGAHRSRAVVVSADEEVSVNLFASGAAPSLVLVEFHCAQPVLTPRTANGLGRLLLSLSRAATNGRGYS